MYVLPQTKPHVIFLHVCNAIAHGYTRHVAQLRSSLFWNLGQRQLILCYIRIRTNRLYRRFGTDTLS